jgi:hypothetical protein
MQFILFFKQLFKRKRRLTMNPQLTQLAQNLLDATAKAQQAVVELNQANADVTTAYNAYEAALTPGQPQR